MVERFSEELHAAAETRPDLAAKCTDLERQLRVVAARLAEGVDEEEEFPF